MPFDVINYFLYAAEDPKIDEVTKKTFSKKESFYFFDTENSTLGLLLTGSVIVEMKIFSGQWTANNIINEGGIFGIENIATNLNLRRTSEYRVTGLEQGAYLEIDKEYLLLNMVQEPIQNYVLDKLIDTLMDINSLHQYTQMSLHSKIIKELALLAGDLNLELINSFIIFPEFVNITFLAKYLNSSRASILLELKNLQNTGTLVSKKPLIINIQKAHSQQFLKNYYYKSDL
ncbi:Crp/Fnr family transcriptional regulator [Listeria sp. PSOL-1]|uniref:Crp/Fnr family transcriptional regulator n=1 Tax=Listeria sp. PSOL-1 TaxID=1844999 RepID=UPI0013D2256B|nr:Crp/Fnr family transcriptional regulator [Listeria sp. PSOL-1]